MIGRRGCRGQSLLETMLAIAIVLLALAAFAGYRLSGAPGVGSAAIAELPALVAQARALAAGSGDGATLAFAQDPVLRVGSLRGLALPLPAQAGWRVRPGPAAPALAPERSDSSLDRAGAVRGFHIEF